MLNLDRRKNQANSSPTSNSMRLDFIHKLHCPYSGSRFDVNTVLHEGHAGVRYAIATSEAGDFPIIDGILRLTADDYRVPLVDLIRSNQPTLALRTALDAPFYGHLGSTINVVDRMIRQYALHGIANSLIALKEPMFRVVTNTTGTLVSTLKKLKSQSWATWQIRRFSMPHFLPIYPLLRLVHGEGQVLDFGCGIGHASFLISRKVPDCQITCADIRFHTLYLARRFFIGNANFICLSGDYPLPFDSGYFSTVLSSDVLHFIDSKLSLSREFRRVVSAHGAIILPHLHNRLSSIRLDKSLTPAGYSALFEGINTRIVAEASLVDQFVTDDLLDLESERLPQELNDAVTGLSLVASGDTALFRRYTGLWREYTESMINPSVNPVYRVTKRNGKCLLKKESADAGGKPIPGSNVYLPDTASIGLSSPDQPSLLALRKSNPWEFSDLTRHFVLIDAPNLFQ